MATESVQMGVNQTDIFGAPAGFCTAATVTVTSVDSALSGSLTPVNVVLLSAENTPLLGTAVQAIPDARGGVAVTITAKTAKIQVTNLFTAGVNTLVSFTP